MILDTVKRREQIIDLLCHEGSVRVEPLSMRFGVSSVTIRNDLRYLEQKAVRCALTAVRCSTSNSRLIGLCKIRGE